MANVSVIIPTYQRAHIVSQAIESVLVQTINDYEIIVVIDGSTDNTKEVLAQFGDKITVIYQENKGIAAARNTGIIAAQGHYIAFLDDDDLWLPNMLEKQLACFESAPKIGLVYSDMFYFNDSGVLPDKWTNVYTPPPVFEILALFARNFIPASTVVVRRECLEEVGLFDETLRFCEDYDLWLRIIEKFPIYFLNEPLGYCRQSANSLQSNREQMLVTYLRVKEKAFSRNPGLHKIPLIVLDLCFYDHYLGLAYSYINRYQGQKARQVLEKYRQLRSVNSVQYELLWMMSFPILQPSPTSDSVTAFTKK